MSCPQNAPAPFACPSLEQSIQATASLFPRGRAWPVNDGGSLIARFLTWLAALNGAVPAIWPAGYVQAGTVAAIGSLRNWVESRFCALRAEFWCATASETLDLWNAEYGLPDPCDPRADLCTRVAGSAGANCRDFVALAARAGWSIVCGDFRQGGGAQAGCALAGHALAGTGLQATVVNITVFVADSPAYTAILTSPPLAGRMLAGLTLNCLPDITPLRCLLTRIAHAHLTLNFVVD